MTQKKLVVAYDGSPNSKNALKLAGELAKAVAVDVFLVSVVETDFGIYRGEIGSREFHQIQEARQKHGEETIESGARQALEWGIPVQTVLLSGNPAGELLNFAQKEGAYMIVVGPRGLGTFESMILGSVTQKILSHAHIPVVVAK